MTRRLLKAGAVQMFSAKPLSSSWEQIVIPKGDLVER